MAFGYKPGKKAIKNLENLVRGFNARATVVNKEYSIFDNYVPIPKQSVEKILSRVHSYADLRRERARLQRFFKKNKKDAQELVEDKKTGKLTTKWFKREYEYMLRRERKMKRDIEKKAKENGKEVPSYPGESKPPQSDRAFEGLADKLGDLALPNVAQLYLEEMRNNGYMRFNEGKEVEKIIKTIFEVFPDYLETLFYTGDERSTIEWLYIDRDDYLSGNMFRKVKMCYDYWYSAATDIAL